MERSLFAATQLPGIDTDRGLHLLAGNEQIYLKLLHSFFEHHAGDRERLDAALQAGEREEARRLVHTLKGLVGNFGAVELESVTVTLEQQLLRGEDDAALQQGVELFRESFSHLIDGLRVFLAKTLPEGEMPGERAVDAARVCALLQQLLVTLFSDLAEAESRVEAIGAELSGTPLYVEGEQLRRLFASYDLEQVEGLARALIAELS